MKDNIVRFVFLITCLASISAFSQTGNEPEALGLPGDNLDLYAVLDVFQKSKTIEDFEKSLNSEKSKINNLDLDNDGKVDFIKVVTKKDGDDFTFVLQDAVSKTETQDVAVILVSKDKNKKVTMQIVGDEELYGKNYIVEPKASGSSVTANPAYTGSDPVTVNVPATTTVVVESAPIVQYVYSPAYVPYYPPYYYGYYPPYFAAFTIMAVGIYRHNHYYYHGGGYGYGNTTVIHNTNNFNNYNNNSRNRSNTVAHNKASGNYKNVGDRSNTGGNRSNVGSGNRASNTSSRPTASPSTRGGTSPSTRATNSSARPASSNDFSRSSSGRSAGSSSYSGGASRRSSSSGFSGSSGRSGSSMSSFRGGGGGRRR